MENITDELKIDERITDESKITDEPMSIDEVVSISYEGADYVFKKIPVTEDNGKIWTKLETSDDIVPIIWTERWDYDWSIWFDNKYVSCSRINLDSELIRMAAEPEYMKKLFSEYFKVHDMEDDDSCYYEHFQKFLAWVLGCEEDSIPWTLGDFKSVRIEFLKKGEKFRIFVYEGFCSFEKFNSEEWNGIDCCTA